MSKASKEKLVKKATELGITLTGEEDEKQIAELVSAKEQEIKDKKAEKNEELKKGPSVKVKLFGGREVEFSERIHGEDYEKQAQEYAAANNGQIA